MKKENKAPRRKFNIFKLVRDIVFYIFVLFLLLFSITTITSSKGDNIPSIFGRGFMPVLSNSMESDLYKDSFNMNDLIIVKPIDYKTYTLDNLKVGDIVTFKDRKDGKDILNTHRIIHIELDENRLQTQGDNPLASFDDPMDYSKVVAVYKSKIPKIGKFITFMQGQLGFGILIVLPLFLMLMMQIFKAIKEFYSDKTENFRKQLLREQEELEKLRAKLLEAQSNKE